MKLNKLKNFIKTIKEQVEESEQIPIEEKVYISDYLKGRRYNKQLVDKLRKDIIKKLKNVVIDDEDNYFEVYFTMSAKYQKTTIIITPRNSSLLEDVENVLDDNNVKYSTDGNSEWYEIEFEGNEK